jgi:hypothetical protein
MKFMLLCYDDEAAWDKAGLDAMRKAIGEAVRLTHDLDAKGEYILARPLHPVATATSVQIREGKRHVTDGPFAETKEALGGFYVIDVPSMEAAIEVAARHPGASLGTVEVRPIVEIPNLPR